MPGDAPFRTLLVVRELASGEVVVFPAAEPKLASFGDEEDALLEQRVFLTSYLSRVAPDVVARHALPAETRLHVSSVVVPRDDLPRRLAIEEPIDLPCLVLPAKHPDENARPESWVCVLPLGHTFHLGAKTDREQDDDERLDEAITHEVRRMVAAEERTPLQWLELVQDGNSRLLTLDLTLDRGETGPAGRAASLAKALADREKQRAALAVLESIGTPLHLESGSAPRPLVLRDEELGLLRSLLSGTTRTSVLLVGGDRVGKTALFQAWVAGERASGKPRPVFATSGAQLIAGMSGLGQWQERVRRVMQAAADLDAVLFFDDLGDLFADRPTGNVDLAGAMKPWLDDAKVRVVGELRESRVDLAESRHVGFFSLLSRLRVPPMRADGATAVLRALLAHDGKHAPHKPQLDAAAVVPLIDLAERYLPYEEFPGKAVRLYDELRGAHEMSAARKGDEPAPKLGLAELYEGFSLRSGVPVFLLREDRTLLQAEVEARLRARVVGQEDAVRRVAETVCMVKAGLQPPGKPLSTFLFVGPTGIGKTELARALAELLFGAQERLVRFDMSEFMDPLAADRLIRGNERGEGLLTRRVREQPFCVVLLDEIEKAHSAVFDLLLQVAGEGRLTDARGRTAHFQNAIVILTSNLGAAHRRSEVGFARDQESHASDEAQYLRVVHETFRPELVNRLDRIVVFRTLERTELTRITQLSIAKISGRRGFGAATAELSVSAAASERLSADGFSPAYGARSLRRHLEVHLVDRTASLVAGFGGLEGHAVAVTGEGEPAPASEVAESTAGGVRISVVSGEKRALARSSRGMGAISAIRREMQRQMRLPKIEQLRDQVEYLVTELNYGGGKRAKKLSGAAVSLSQAEHHRLSTLHGALDLAYRDVCTLEELALAGFFEGQPLDELSDEAGRTRGGFRTALARALVAQETRRDAIALLLQELDDGRGLTFWLSPLLVDAARRKFGVTVHFEADGGTGPYGRYGVAMPGDLALEFLQTQKPRSAVVLVQGEMCAPFLALEGGVHRFDGLHPEHPEVYLLVQRLAFRASLSGAEWRGKKVVPALPAVVAEMRRIAPHRHFDAREGRLTILKRARLALTHDEYFPRLEEIALEHMLLCERDDGLDRDDWFTCVLDGLDDILDTAKQGNLILAIKEYRERFGVGLKEAKDAVEALVRRSKDDGA